MFEYLWWPMRRIADEKDRFKYAPCFIGKFTKFCHIIPVKDTTTETLARELYALSALHGSPVSILSDRGAAHLTLAIRKL